jgi:putative membrane protein
MLDRPTLLGLFDAWTLQPVAVVASVAMVAWYVRTARRVPEWPRRRTVCFLLGVALLAWGTNGFPQVYAPALFWVWTSQVLFLLLVVPAVLMTAQPIGLARRVSGERALLVRASRSGVGRFFANPLVGPALIPLLSAALFFGPLPRWAIDTEALGWPLQLTVVAVGSLVMLPLLNLDDTSSSLAVGLALAIGAFELVLDAVPGIILRLNTHLVTSYFDVRTRTTWAPTPLHDQQIAGAILWSVAELIDLPFLVLVYRQWLRADERDAARIDTVLDAERIARGGEDAAPTDEPWWLSDPAMRNRFKRN